MEEKSEKKTEKKNKILEDAFTALKSKTITIETKANEQGNLFATLDASAVAQAILNQEKIKLDPALILLKEHIKSVGEHVIEIGEGDTKTNITIEVKAE